MSQQALSQKPQSPQSAEGDGKSQQKKKISFSELKIWNECPFKHKLNYVDGIKSFTGNEYTAFGTAIHYVCEMKVQDSSVDGEKLFKEKFVEEIKAHRMANITSSTGRLALGVGEQKEKQNQ